MQSKGWKGLALATALGVLVLAIMYSLPAARPTVPGAMAAPGNEASALLANVGPYAVADVAERVSPAVVYIEVEYKAPERTTRQPFSSPFGGLWDMWWFGAPDISQRQTVSQGSGVIISSDGQILTNQHVVDNQSTIKEIRVYVEGRGEPYVAELLGSDYLLDLAVLKVTPRGKLSVADLGDSDKTRVGEFVVAIGNPYGKDFDHTVTLGVLSAKGRQIKIPDTSSNSVREYRNLMQTDAAINPRQLGWPVAQPEW